MNPTPSLRAARTLALLSAIATSSVAAETVPISFTVLPGLAGVNGTTVFLADLSSIPLGEIQSITLIDINSGVGGSPGAYSGFDLDAIKISPTLAATAAAASLLPAVDVFDFAPSGTLFTPGTQRPPVAPKLNGTDPTGQYVDPAFATLHAFDAIWFGPGSVSLGDGGRISFNLTSPISPAGLYLYIGEVGFDGGEGIAGTLFVSDVPVIPEPSTWLLFAAGLGVVAAAMKRRQVTDA